MPILSTRRTTLIGSVLLAACTNSPHAPPDPHAFVRRAIVAAGGESALGAARVLAWTGTGLVHAGASRIEIGVDTLVEPFSYARSTSWLIGRGRQASERTLELDGDAGFAIRNGVREPLPEAQLVHERQQFALYGLMRLLPLLDAGVSLAFGENAAPSRTALDVRHPMAPPTSLIFDEEARLVGARNVVPDAETGAEVEQDVTFAGAMVSNGVRWPRTLSIRQNGAPYFDLTLASFAARAGR